MTNALREAEMLGLDTVQVFTKNQQQWNAKPLDPASVREWSAECARLKWNDGRIVSHASYLANLASVDEDLREKSIALMRIEIERCEQLGIRLLCFHPGAFTTSTLEQGIVRIADACGRLINETAGFSVVLCLENVAGQGSTIGRTFEELADIRRRIVEATGEPGRIGFCIDTAHAHAAGYDLSTSAGAQKVVKQLCDTLNTDPRGEAAIRCMHLNDSKTPCGSRVDRHAHIGEGTIGLAGFAAMVNHPAFSGIPKVMETPKGETKGQAWDLDNVARLRGLIGHTGTVFSPVVPIEGGPVGVVTSGPVRAKPAATPAKRPAGRTIVRDSKSARKPR